MTASEFAYDLKFKLFNYKFYKLAKRHEHLLKDGWKKYWIEKKHPDGYWEIVYGRKS